MTSEPTPSMTAAEWCRTRDMADPLLDPRELAAALAGDERQLVLGKFFKDALRSYYSGKNTVDLSNLMRIAQSGVLGDVADIRRAASKTIADCTQDFTSWDAMLRRGGFEQSLRWMIEQQWCDAAALTEGLQAIPAQFRQGDLEQPLLEMVRRMEAEATNQRMETDTPRASGLRSAPRL